MSCTSTLQSSSSSRNQRLHCRSARHAYLAAFCRDSPRARCRDCAPQLNLPMLRSATAVAQAVRRSLQQSPPQRIAQAPAPAGPRLTLADAERMAIQHNPNISIAHLLQLAQAQVVREARSGELPDGGGRPHRRGSARQQPHHRWRFEQPTVYDRAAGGLTVDQLITDFGRTHNLVQSAQSNARAQLETERATVEDITLAVDQAFYQALTAQSVLKVAQQTVATRQATGEQIGALTQSKLRSTLDLSLANVQISQAQLLVLDAQNAVAIGDGQPERDPRFGRQHAIRPGGRNTGQSPGGAIERRRPGPTRFPRAA